MKFFHGISQRSQVRDSRKWLLMGNYCYNTIGVNSFFFGKTLEENIMNLNNRNFENATIVDVRTEWEFESENVAGSVNIPLHEVPARLEEFRSMAKPLLLVCHSGNRSGQACNYLQSQGVECENAGSWWDVHQTLLRKVS